MIPIVVTLVGIITDVRLLQLTPLVAKAASAIEVNWSGIVSTPTGQSKNGTYTVTDDGMIDGGNDVPPNANDPNNI